MVSLIFLDFLNQYQQHQVRDHWITPLCGDNRTGVDKEHGEEDKELDRYLKVITRRWRRWPRWRKVVRSAAGGGGGEGGQEGGQGGGK